MNRKHKVKHARYIISYLRNPVTDRMKIIINEGLDDEESFEAVMPKAICEYISDLIYIDNVQNGTIGD